MRRSRTTTAARCGAASCIWGSARSPAPTSRCTSTTCSRRATRTYRSIWGSSVSRCATTTCRTRSARRTACTRSVSSTARRRRTGSSDPCDGHCTPRRRAPRCGRRWRRPTLTIVSVTVTEKGYCIDPATRRLDRAHPDVRHDVDHPDTPRSVVGHLVLAARDRRAGGAGDLTVLSLDNLSANGSTLRSVVSELAAVGDPSLAEWIDEHLAFPNSMVDRMVPATDDKFREAVDSTIGLHDAWPVRAEPYSQWVVERRWAAPMPPLGDVGVQVVDDVAPWEMLKLPRPELAPHGGRALRPAPRARHDRSRRGRSGRAGTPRPRRRGDRRSPRRAARRRRRRVHRNDARALRQFRPRPPVRSGRHRHEPEAPAAAARHDSGTAGTRARHRRAGRRAGVVGLVDTRRRPSGRTADRVRPPRHHVHADRVGLHPRRPRRHIGAGDRPHRAPDLRRPRRQPCPRRTGRHIDCPPSSTAPNTWR